MAHRAVVALVLISILAPACAVQPLTIPAGEIVVFAYKLGSFGDLEPLEPYTTTLAPDSTPVGQVPRSIGFSPSWSPDGMWIATSNARDDLVFYSTRSHQTIEIPTGLSRVDEIHWFPDSMDIVFTASPADTQSKIYRMDLSCLATPRECHPPSKELLSGHSPSVSYDETWLAYVDYAWDCRSPDPPCQSVFISPIELDSPPINVAAPIEPTLASNEWPMWGCYDQYAHPQWSPTDPTLAFACGFDVYTYDLSSGTLMNLTSMATPLHTEHNFPTWWPRDYMPSWTSRGDRILFLSDRDDDLGENGSDFIANALFSMNPDGSDPTRITHGSDQMITRYAWINR